ncbi:MAG: 50S ribosomal protein L25/general stress protein Ctc [Rhodospirillales bacterium]|nr:50S ribosomal protein L25/general stress protein Ctc [Rhodospirillales bacterium]MCB9973566.1 50S ribosomal protein L25/general stress protein Ctc [Rhodospirillales bacterium]MCB9979630.1 50S ribosomal protein L25/general stress protein Ctc [Rhodospirillales bacterium]
MSTKHIKFSAELRDKAGKGVARALRRENKIPAVIYGAGKPAITISLSAKDANLEYNKGHMFTFLSDVTVDGEKYLTLARDVQLHPVKDTVLHVDFMRVGPKTKIDVNVPVHFVNEEEATFSKRGGVLNVVRHEIGLTCVATDIPESIEIDLMPFEIGDAIKISDVALPKGTKPVIDDRDFTIATVAAPKKASAGDDAAEGESAEGASEETSEE